jgi:hypothetical protein
MKLRPALGFHGVMLNQAYGSTKLTQSSASYAAR